MFFLLKSDPLGGHEYKLLVYYIIGPIATFNNVHGMVITNTLAPKFSEVFIYGNFIINGLQETRMDLGWMDML